METFFTIIISALVILCFIKLLWKGSFNFSIILPNHFDMRIRHEVHLHDRQFDELYSLVKETTRKELMNWKDPYERGQAQRKIDSYTVESFKLYVERNCMIDKEQFIQNEFEHNQVRLNIAKEKGWGFSTQVRQHCIKIINEVLKENQGT